MNKVTTRILTAIGAVRELGPRQTFWYAVYQAGLRSGFYQRVTPAASYPDGAEKLRSPFYLPAREELRTVLGAGMKDLILEADEIVSGRVRLFGGPPVRLNLAPPDTSKHWTYYESRPATWGVEDIKFLWEPARFGWAYPLGRAYIVTGDEAYPAAFWQNFEWFLSANPPNQGPNWASAQEAALRLLAFLFAARAFESSIHTTPERLLHMAGAVDAHATRIPPTLSYARAQENNHRISEALGLAAAGWALPHHPEAPKWKKAGWSELNSALLNQISPDGTYAQHSMNYHRLMLHAALQATLFEHAFSGTVLRRLAAATKWLLAQIDPVSGRAPNLGSNDGANILPLAAADFGDFRPTGQAAARAFLGQAAFPPGPWDELGLWLGQAAAGSAVTAGRPAWPPAAESQAVHRMGSPQTWAALRAVQFHSRPAHADQLHVELWWQGENIACDAGTYRYTAAAPWENALAQTCVHNTVEVDGQNQMRRAGKFLWLDWAQATLLPTADQDPRSITAQHNGYRRLGILHRRTLTWDGALHWQVIDSFESANARRPGAALAPSHSYRLHWLLPDWPWQLEGTRLKLARPGGGSLRLAITHDLPGADKPAVETISLVCAGKALAGAAAPAPILGWYAPTYNQKVPALSFSITCRAALPFHMVSDWILDPGSTLPE